MDIEKRKEELKRKINEIRRKREEKERRIAKRRHKLFEKLNEYKALVKIIEYSSGSSIVDCDGVTHRLKIGSVLVLPLPNAIPLVRAGVGVILAKFPRNANVPKLNLCQFCRCSAKAVRVYDVKMPEGKVLAVYHICSFCGKVLRTEKYDNTWNTKK